jgi:predicted metallo-beta-lactamase superfamily hydrolase
MDLIPVAFDSMGVRSMCCFVKSDPAILIDPGVSLAPTRFGLPPHQSELKKLLEKRRMIQDYGKKADILTISHWHNDHHTPFINGLYGSVTPGKARSLYCRKTVLAKGVKGLNFMQKKRALSFQNHCTFVPCDQKRFSFNGMTLKFSHPVSHGTFKKIPVVMLSISVEGETKIVHASDIQGLSGLSFIKDENPDLLIMSGPPAYFLNPEELSKARSNILEALDYCDQLILDHHHVRDLAYKEILHDVWKSTKVKTAAEYAGQPNCLLEAKRKELYSSEELKN